MSNNIQIEWNLKPEELNSCAAGSALAERLINSLAANADFHCRKDLVGIVMMMCASGGINTKAGEGFMAKVNFVMRMASGLS
ncbi:hypothetical protein [Rheinheimera sp.]|uniref:hypothetical protein n=1 Tax=Rheinheimera sp. TaxID=1869214 RepID=UPI0027337E4A|nr:hypothetical protein [Rheinheimera sp.]MDP2715550.1 hypothetical protein [Rheinheimera sp.]